MTPLNLALVVTIAILVALLCLIAWLDAKHRREVARREAAMREHNADLLRRMRKLTERLYEHRDARLAAEARLAPFVARNRGAGGKFVKVERS